MKTLAGNKVLAVGMIVILIISLTTCEKQPTKPEKSAPPELPPVQSMQMNLSFFNKSGNFSFLNKTTLSKYNFTAAASRVLFINTVVVVASILPTAVFAAAINQPPVLKEDGKFHWIYNYSEGIYNFSVDLAGWIDTPNAEAVWEVYVSSNTHYPQLEHFLWYDGRSKIDKNQGWWLFHDDKSPDSLINVLRIDWELADENEQELIFTNVREGRSEYADSLKYAIEFTDRFLILFDASESKTSTIYWNADSHAGFIEWYDYKDGTRSYWDGNLNDTGPPT